MSTITKERIELFIKNPLENGLTRGEQMELARIALASLEAEAVSQPIMFIDGDISSEGADKLARVIREFNEEDERPLAKMARIIRENPHPTNECDMPRNAPAPVSVPDAMDGQGGVCCEVSYADGWNSCRAAMLQGSQPVSNRDELLPSIKPAPELDSVAKNAKSPPGNSPVIPDGYALVPKRLTAENFAKAALAGEFSETKFINCPECFGDDECETCDGSGRIEIKVPVSWNNIKAIWDKGIEHFSSAAPQQEVKS